MTTLYMVLGGVGLFALGVMVLVMVSKKLGAASSRVDTLELGEKRREAFVNASNRSLAFGRDLIVRLRNLREPR